MDQNSTVPEKSPAVAPSGRTSLELTIISLVTGVLSMQITEVSCFLFFFGKHWWPFLCAIGLLLTIPSIACGIFALKKRTPEMGVAIAGLTLGTVAAALAAALMISGLLLYYLQ